MKMGKIYELRRISYLFLIQDEANHANASSGLFESSSSNFRGLHRTNEFPWKKGARTKDGRRLEEDTVESFLSMRSASVFFGRMGELFVLREFHESVYKSRRTEVWLAAS